MFALILDRPTRWIRLRSLCTLPTANRGCYTPGAILDMLSCGAKTALVKYFLRFYAVFCASAGALFNAAIYACLTVLSAM
jgi:hypothetical protein